MISKRDARILARAVLAVDADTSKSDEGSWFTMNGTHVHCPEGVSKADAGRLFAAKKQAGRQIAKEEGKKRQAESMRKAKERHEKAVQEQVQMIRGLMKTNPLAYMDLLKRYSPAEYERIKKRAYGKDASPDTKGNVTEQTVLAALQGAYELGLRHGLENSLISLEHLKLDAKGQADIVNHIHGAQEHIERDRDEIISVCMNDFPALYQRAMEAEAMDTKGRRA